MERMLVVILNDESKAYEAADSLKSLNEEGAIGLTGEWVLTRQQDGDVSIVKHDDTLPEGTMGGTVVGGLIGLFGGPVGLAIGAATGAAAGATADMARARLEQDFVADISACLAPGKTALVAEINEDEPEAVDARMDALGGRIFRRDLLDFADADYGRRADQLKSRVAHASRDIAHDYRTRTRNLTSRVKGLFHTGDRDDEGTHNKR
jgi:uncharacterized membrane protein